MISTTPFNITTHEVNPANSAIEILVLDEKGHGGAHHHYRVTINKGKEGQNVFDILFQNGPINECGVNGLTHEVLLAIVRHRLECFQEGKYRCAENEAALAHTIASQEALLSRTRARIARGVEGTHQL